MEVFLLIFLQILTERNRKWFIWKQNKYVLGSLLSVVLDYSPLHIIVEHSLSAILVFVIFNYNRKWYLLNESSNGTYLCSIKSNPIKQVLNHGAVENKFKTCYNKHNCHFKHDKNGKETELSSHIYGIWKCEEDNTV